MFSKKIKFVKSYCPTNAKKVDHYVEGLLTDYRATMRHHNTLVAAMDEGLRVEVDLATPGGTIVKSRKKRK